MRSFATLITIVMLATAGLGLQGCVLAAAGAGAAGGYAAHEEGYRVQSPVKKDEVGGYKGQNPVTHDESKDKTLESNAQK
jgi:osmotically-inducible protein OsmY